LIRGTRGIDRWTIECAFQMRDDIWPVHDYGVRFSRNLWSQETSTPNGFLKLGEKWRPIG
jgi:3-methyladenine DNA glycosylase/8-oxoguanine DNA glycosylase